MRRFVARQAGETYAVERGFELNTIEHAASLPLRTGFLTLPFRLHAFATILPETILPEREIEFPLRQLLFTSTVSATGQAQGAK